MRRPPNKLVDDAQREDELLDDASTDESSMEPDELAKEVTDPLLASIREELKKVDVSKFKK
mgnify:CR=1 FL=1